MSEVGDVEEIGPCLDPLPLKDVARDDVPRHRRVERRGARGAARSLQIGDLVRGEIEQEQTASRALHQVPAAVADRPQRRAGQPVAGPYREEVLLRGGHQLGAVDGEQRLALPHHLTGRVRVEPLDPPADLRMEMVQAGASFE